MVALAVQSAAPPVGQDRRMGEPGDGGGPVPRVPAAAVTAAAVVHTIAAKAVKGQQETRHAVSAVLLENAPVSVPRVSGSGDRFPVKVRWSTPSGPARTGSAKVAADSPRGSTTTAWLGRSGQQTSPPMSRGQVASLTAVAATTGGVLAVVFLVTVRGLIRRAADRGRMAEWEQAWSQVGPRWGRRPA
ncbi:Rv1733c family protein [Streptomyces sp. RKAG337]|uniref:Rv1733c family protein n=1 Tax=Streptomyces sp. RKAG337 TaxID=2893404 RepID=UPI003F8F3769